MKTFFSILSLIFYTPLSTAQVAEEEQPVVESQSVAAATIPGNQTRSQFNHIISVNFIPLFGLLKNSPGIGLGYQYIINDHYSIGSNFYYKRQSLTENFLDVFKLQYINAGVEARYKISSFSEDGFYGGIGLLSSGVQGDVEMKSIFVGGKTEKARTSYQWEALLVPRLGYTWLPSSKRSYGDISVSYEAINKVDYVYGREFENSHPAFMDIKKRRLGLNVTFLGGFVF